MLMENRFCPKCRGDLLLNPYDELVCVKCGNLIEDKEPPKPWQLAKKLQEDHHFITLSDTEEILLFEDGIYISAGETFIKSVLQNIVSEEYVNKRLCEEVIGHIQRSTYKQRNEFENDSLILVFKNCIFNLLTFEMQSHNPDNLSRVKLPVAYESNLDCPNIKKFIGEVMYKEDIPVVQEYVGYCLWRNYEAQKALMLVGEGGNGKSTFITIIQAMLGINNISSRSLQDLEMNRFAKASLYDKLANLYPDLSDVALKSTGTFKSLTGGDPVSAEYKFKNAFSFVNSAKFIFSCNKIPEAHDDTTAFFRRWIILVFPNRFEGDKENKSLLKELTTPEELSGFLNWALEGLNRLKKNNWVFSYSKSTEEIREAYIRKSSPIQAFLMDRVVDNPDAYISKKELFKVFAEYCRSFKLPVVTQNTFYTNLPKHKNVAEAKKKYPPGIGIRVNCYLGIELKDAGTREDEGQVKLDNGACD